MTSLGLNNEGHPIVPSYVEMSSIQDGASYNTKESKLWTRLATLYRKDIVKRYAELRNNKIFDADNIVKFYKELVVDKISEDNYYLDAEKKYLNLPNGPNRLAQGTRLATVKKWLEERLIFCDTLFDYTLYTGSTVQFRANKPGAKVTLSIKTYSPQYVTVTFSKGDKVTKFCNKDRFTEFVGTAPAGDQNQEMFISSAPFLMEIGGLSGDTQVSSLFFESAKRLRKLDVSGSKILSDLSLSTMTSLQEFYAYNCSALTSSLDLSSCDNLRIVDVHNAPISGILFNTKGGSLTELNLSNTNIAQLILKKQPFLREIDLSNCKKLVTVDISDCPRLERLILPNTLIEIFKVSNCENLLEINVSEGKNLSEIQIYNCPKLNKLDISRNYGIKSVINLTGCQGLETIIADSCSKLKYVVFNEKAKETLKNINFSGCASLVGITTRTMTNGDITESELSSTCMDFEGFTIEDLNLYNCQSITRVKNLSYIAKKPNQLFYNCAKLTGFDNSTLTLVQNIDNAFRNCYELSDLPTLDLSKIVSASQTFESCHRLTIDSIKTIMHSFSDKFIEQYRMFFNCKGINVTDNNFPEDLFKNCVNLRSLTEIFLNCENINSEFPERLLQPLKSLKTTYNAFSGCRFKGTLKANVFSCITNGEPNTDLTSVFGTFKENLFTDYDENIFSKLTNLQNADYFFASNTKLGYVAPETLEVPNFIKANLFANNAKLRTANYFFSGCTELNGSLYNGDSQPILLFKNNPELSSISYFFNQCKKITGKIPEKIFWTNQEGNSAINNVSFMFCDCSGITGTIPKKLFEKTVFLSTCAYLFKGCRGLVHEDVIEDGTGIRVRIPFPPNLLSSKSELTDISSLFEGCLNLRGNIPALLLNGCKNVRKVNNLFKDCEGLTGEIPSDLLSYSTEITEAVGIFRGCRNLNGTIPPNLFEKCTKVLDLSYAFYNCDNITGGVPETLLHKCVKLENVSFMFEHCERICETGIGFKYAIPENLFLNCPDLIDASHMFYYCYGLKGNTITEADGQQKTYGIPPLLFYNNPKLKKLNHMFWACEHIGGEIPENLFSEQTDQLQDISFMFFGCRSLTKIYKEMFGRVDSVTGQITTNVPNILNFEETFANCANLTGEAPELWKTHKGAKGTKCFAGIPGLTNEIDPAWK